MNNLVLYEPRNYKLYVHVNPFNNKKYFGITKNETYERWEKGSGYKRGTHIRNAFCKYGWNNFAHFVILNNLTYSEALNFEESYIKIFNTTNKKYGYNKDKGGKEFAKSIQVKKSMENRGLVKPVVHLETRKVYSNSSEASYRTGYKEASIRRTCNSRRFLLFNSHWMFKEDFDKKTNEEIESILNIKPKSYHDDIRKVICLETLEIFNNASEAQKVYNSTTTSCIRACCKHTDPNRITAAKKHWLYLEEYEELSKKEIKNILNNKAGRKISKAVIKLETLEVFPSIEDASLKTGLSNKTIRYSCTGLRTTNLKNGHWMFKSDYDILTSKEVEKRLQKRRKATNTKRVKCKETGIIFDSLTEASNAVGGGSRNSSISRCCKNPNLTYKGFHWEYA